MASELRQWMQENIGGLRDDRDTESCALEFLKTANSNLKLSQSKTDLTLAANQLEYFSGWVREQLGKMDTLVAEIRSL